MCQAVTSLSQSGTPGGRISIAEILRSTVGDSLTHPPAPSVYGWENGACVWGPSWWADGPPPRGQAAPARPRAREPASESARAQPAHATSPAQAEQSAQPRPGVCRWRPNTQRTQPARPPPVNHSHQNRQAPETRHVASRCRPRPQPRRVGGPCRRPLSRGHPSPRQTTPPSRQRQGAGRDRRPAPPGPRRHLAQNKGYQVFRRFSGVSKGFVRCSR